MTIERQNKDAPLEMPPSRERIKQVRRRRKRYKMKRIKMMLAAIALMPFMALATTWYVDGVNGSDANTGKSQSTAKKTIQAAIDVSGAGDTILVSAGTYEPIVTANKLITINGVEGAKRTIIDGGRKKRCVTVKSDASEGGIFTNSVVRGFTIRNGWAAEAGTYNNYCAGNLWGGTAVRCIITGGEGRSGGCACETVLRDCLIYDNYAQYNGGACDGCVLINCTLVGNKAEHQGGACCSSVLHNCIVYGNSGYSQEFDGRGLGWRNDLIDAYTPYRANVCTDDPMFVDAANGDYRLASDSPCIDAGDNSYVGSGTDLDGNARIVNGTVDIGCYEYGTTPVNKNQLYCGYISDYSGLYNLDRVSYPTETNIVSQIASATECRYDVNAEYRTTVYWGEMYFDAGTYRLAGCFDDYIVAKINGVVILEGFWENGVKFGNFTIPSSGWYPVDFRFHNNGDVAGDTYHHYSYGCAWTCSKNLAIENITADPESTDVNPANFTVVGLDANGDEVPGTFRLPQQLSLTEGLVAWYKFDNNLADSSGNNYDMQSLNPLEDGAYCEDRTGRAGAAISISNNRLVSVGPSLKRDSNSQLYYESDIALTNYWTFSCWFKTDKNTTLQPETTSGIYGASSGIQYLYFENTCNIAVGKNGINVFEHDSYYLPATLRYEASFGNEWHHLAVVSNGREAGFKLYVDGEFVRDGLISGREKRIDLGWINSARTEANGIGGGYYGSSYDGCLDDLRFYNRALSSAEVKAIYNEDGIEAGVFTCTQYNLNVRPYSISGAETYIVDSSKWDGEPISASYSTISFEDNLYQATTHFDTVPFPGNNEYKHDYFCMVATGRVFIPTAGYWTFASGVDDGFRVVLANADGDTYSFESDGEQSFHTVVQTFCISTAGIYNLRAIYFETGNEAAFDLSAAKGSYSSFDSSAFKLVGTAESGITLVGNSDPTVYRTVTFDANGGTADETSRRVEDGAAVGTLPTATRTGYAFLGWFTEVTGGTEVTEATEVTSDGTCYAHWQANEYTIAFDGNGSTGGSTAGLSVAYDADATLTANGFTKTGYSFAGWSQYNWGDVEYGDQDTVCNLTDENGATVTLYAVWTPIDYSVSFYGNGSDWGSMSSQWFTYDSWENLNANQYGKTGYSFDGWATTSDGSVAYENGASVVNLASTAGADVGLFAKWRVNQYTITFNANGGSTDMSSVTRDYGTAIGSMTDAWRTGYDFLGWFTSSSGGSQATSQTTVTGNATLYAHWQLKTYTITVDANGGDAVPSFTRQHGSTIGSLPIPSRVGHVFKGWFTAPEGGDRIGVSQVVTSDLALYAHWSTYAQEIAEAMPGATNVRFSTDDSAPWTRDASVSSDGESVRSYPVTAGGESAMEAQVYGSGNFMFDWRVSSASRVGVLTYYVDGVQKKQISGSVDWRTVDIEISGDGTHTVRWVYAKSGSDVSGSDCGWVDAISWSGGSFPVVSYTVSFNVNGGDSSIPSVTRESGTTIGTLPTPTMANATFLGWFTAASGGTQVTAETTVTANMTIYAHWKVNDPTPGNCTVTFNANGGTCSTTATTVASGSSVGTLPTATRTGYALVGWFTAASGGSQVSDSSIVSASVTWYAHWQANAYNITYVDTKDAENPNPTTYTIANAVTFADLPNVDGWRFVGWSVTGIPAGSTGDKTVTANWETAPDIGGGGEDDDPMDASIANAYDGVIVDADGLPMGYINVKTAKALGKGEAKTSKVTATIQMAGEAKKVTVKASVPVSEASFTATASDDRVLDLSFSRYGIWGTFDGYEIEGVRNLLASTAKSDKGTDAKAAAEAAYAALKGNYVMAYEDENGWNGLSVTVMAKGNVKVSGKLVNGTSVATTSQLIVGDEYSVIPVIYAKGATSLAFNVYFPNDGGEAEVFGYWDAVISRAGNIGSGLSFCLGQEFYDLYDDVELLEFLPDGVSVEPSGTKWVVAGGAKKSGKIVVDKESGEAYDKNESENPAALKLTYTAKTGTFKGSFKIYYLLNGKVKSDSATITGFVVNGIGYGTVTVKKRGSACISIE